MAAGFLLINKPPGPTSHDVVDAVRRVTGIKTVGHAGTLDPFAAGLLIIGVGREATRRLDSIKSLPKTYLATIRLGAISDTDDNTGRVAISNFQFPISKQDIKKTLTEFIGEIDQVPPMYSAKKVGGKKLYELARQGKTIQRKPQRVMIHSIRLLDIGHWSLVIEVQCSSGTYIRALARDIGERLGCGAYCEALTRTAIGLYTLSEAITLEQLAPYTWQLYLHPISNFSRSGGIPLTIGHKIQGAGQFPISKLDKLQTEKLKTIVLVFGTFDLLHPGHLDFFRQAKGLGDHLIAGIGRDQVVAQLKGKLPRQNERERLAGVQECGLVDEAHLLPENPQERFLWIKTMNPAVIALGYDQIAFTDHLAADFAAHGINCQIIRLKSFHPERYKSSKMNAPSCQ